MGTALNGKELGRGIHQIPNGKYIARFTNKMGKRVKREFYKLHEAREWLAIALDHEQYGVPLLKAEVMNVDSWFDYWMEVKKYSIRDNTIAAYEIRYRKNIHPIIGRIALDDVKPLHCQHVINTMSKSYKSASVKLTKDVMYMLFKYAVDNDVLDKNPARALIVKSNHSDKKREKVLTIEEQDLLIEALEKPKYPYRMCYAFALQTGLRSSELAGINWSDINIGERTLNVRRIYYYNGKYKVGSPKSAAGIRTIPLTAKAIEILNYQAEIRKYVGNINPAYEGLVFFSEVGEPVKNTCLNKELSILCHDIGINPISMHALRHTFATRCVEGGINIKTLQVILGHSNISITMDKYVHVTNNELMRSIDVLESSLAKQGTEIGT